MKDNKNYELEEKELFNYMLDSDLLPLPHGGEDEKYFVNKHNLELIIRSECNQQCEYCYIYRYGKDLYPTHNTRQQTLENVAMVLDYVFVQRRNWFYDIELFAGDLFYDAIYFDVMDLIDNHFKVIKRKSPELFDRQVVICCPCNLRWVYERPELIPRFREYYNHFMDEYGVFLSISWSSDGLYAVDAREKQEFTDEYFDKIFTFTKEFQCGYHPMIAPENIKTWCENYDWWMAKYEQFGLTYPKYFQPYLLEVRNGNWTEDLLPYHDKFLEHLMQWRLKLCNNDVEQLAYHLIIGDGANGTLQASNGCDPLKLTDSHGSRCDEGIKCSGQDLIHFNCVDLSIVQCHRTSYTQFTPIYFIPDEKREHIIDFKPNNVGAYITWRYFKTENLPICATCEYNKICKQGCPGAQFEVTGELYLPISSLCHFFKTRIEFLWHLYEKYGIIDVLKKAEWFKEKDFEILWLKDRVFAPSVEEEECCDNECRC